MTPKGYSATQIALHWIVALLVVVPLLVVAAVGLPLFQDGSSYLVELMTSQSAVRHHRYSVLLVQAPSIVALKLSATADLDPRSALTVVRVRGFGTGRDGVENTETGVGTGGVGGGSGRSLSIPREGVATGRPRKRS